MNFSDKLKEIRKKEGLSQEQLAEKIGVSRQAITKWETGKGLPDIENMAILAEIFKTTIDELVSETAARSKKADVFSSETVYDIDREKHFDINIGSAASLMLSTGNDEKLHVCLKSETLENLAEVFKIKLDENRNRLDVDCVGRGKISGFEAQEAIQIEITLPEKYTEHCEIAASVKQLEILSLDIRHLEYDGSAESIIVKDSKGRLEFTSKSDFDITADRVFGEISVYQLHAKTLFHIDENACPAVKNTGRKCSVIYMKNGKKTDFTAPGGDGELKVTGVASELIVDLK